MPRWLLRRFNPTEAIRLERIERLEAFWDREMSHHELNLMKSPHELLEERNRIDEDYAALAKFSRYGSLNGHGDET